MAEPVTEATLLMGEIKKLVENNKHMPSKAPTHITRHISTSDAKKYHDAINKTGKRFGRSKRKVLFTLSGPVPAIAATAIAGGPITLAVVGGAVAATAVGYGLVKGWRNARARWYRGSAKRFMGGKRTETNLNRTRYWIKKRRLSNISDDVREVVKALGKFDGYASKKGSFDKCEDAMRMMEQLYRAKHVADKKLEESSKEFLEFCKYMFEHSDEICQGPKGFTGTNIDKAIKVIHEQVHSRNHKKCGRFSCWAHKEIGLWERAMGSVFNNVSRTISINNLGKYLEGYKANLSKDNEQYASTTSGRYLYALCCKGRIEGSAKSLSYKLGDQDYTGITTTSYGGEVGKGVGGTMPGALGSTAVFIAKTTLKPTAEAYRKMTGMSAREVMESATANFASGVGFTVFIAIMKGLAEAANNNQALKHLSDDDVAMVTRSLRTILKDGGVFEGATDTYIKLWHNHKKFEARLAGVDTCDKAFSLAKVILRAPNLWEEYIKKIFFVRSFYDIVVQALETTESKVFDKKETDAQKDIKHWLYIKHVFKECCEGWCYSGRDL